MTMPVETIYVECPSCHRSYQDWTRGSMNLDLDDFTEEYIREASTAKCPYCGTVVELATLVVDDGMWTFSGSPGSS